MASTRPTVTVPLNIARDDAFIGPAPQHLPSPQLFHALPLVIKLMILDINGWAFWCQHLGDPVMQIQNTGKWTIPGSWPRIHLPPSLGMYYKRREVMKWIWASNCQILAQHRPWTGRSMLRLQITEERMKPSGGQTWSNPPPVYGDPVEVPDCEIDTELLPHIMAISRQVHLTWHIKYEGARAFFRLPAIATSRRTRSGNIGNTNNTRDARFKLESLRFLFREKINNTTC